MSGFFSVCPVSPCYQPFTVSGASRGIGLHLASAILERYPHAFVFAGARDPSTARELNAIAGTHENVKVIKLIVDDEDSNKRAVAEISEVTDRLDIVVANAGKLGSRTLLYYLKLRDTC